MSLSLDSIEVICNFVDPPPGTRPHLLVDLSIQDRSPGRTREIYLPVQASFFYVNEKGAARILGPGIDVTNYPSGLSDSTIPRAQPLRMLIGMGLGISEIGAISTTFRSMSVISLEARFVSTLLNDVRTVNQRMVAFTPVFRFALDVATWNSWLTRWEERYAPSDLSKTVPQEIAADYAEGVRCLNVEAYRACVVMLRRSLESAGIEKGGTGRDLLSILQSLVEKRVLSAADHALASGVRMFGNYGAHPSTDRLATVSRDDADLVLHVTKQLLKKMFGT